MPLAAKSALIILTICIIRFAVDAKLAGDQGPGRKLWTRLGVLTNSSHGPIISLRIPAAFKWLVS